MEGSAVMRRKPREVCVDSNLVIKLVTDDKDSELVSLLFETWKKAGIRMIAPAFYSVEVDSTLRRAVVSGSKKNRLTDEQAEVAFDAAQSLPIEIIEVEGRRQRAWELAKRLGQSVVYDTTYIALAELRRCEFWTADERIYNAATQAGLKHVRLLSQWQPSKRKRRTHT
jgi:predicted nucleic acid-binding protein